MGKRLFRIFQKDILPQINNLLNKEVNVIFKNNLTLHGKIIGSKSNTFNFSDMMNRRHEFTIESIAEIHIDKEAAF